MDNRYEILEQIASGDFATVYRARDRELNREVAVKQIHKHFLAEPAKLSRYWQEAQLLASLEHPHIMTIYDLVRSRGWLVLELMRGSLKDKTQGQPLNLDYLRIALFHSLHALKFLHSKGILHGDVKPSNLLIDKRGRVKLGDFGLARRANNDEGSLLKGTTKYMAPEVVSDQFGRVGPASDLYSLGFSAYELMCGEQFESLFPGLNAYGRDKQVAWMMWHAAADRRLPPIARVMDGVPPDLAAVIERLTAKNPAERYPTADAALADLMRDPNLLATPAPEDELPAMSTAQKRKRFIAIGAFAVSCLLCVAMLVPWGSRSVAQPPPEIEPGRGIVREVLAGEGKIIVEVNEEPLEITVHKRDRVFLNDKASLLRQLREGDLLTIKKYRDEAGRPILDLAAARPESAHGRIESLQADEGQMTVAIEDGEHRGEKLPLEVPADVKFTFNGQRELANELVRLADLRVGDQVEVTHVEQERGRIAVALSARRLMPQAGVIRSLDAKKGELTIAASDEEGAARITLPFAEKCEVTLNGRQLLGGRILTWRDLKPGDRAELLADTRIARIDAKRQFQEEGEVHAIKFDPPLMQVFLRGQSQSRDYRVGVECKVTLGGEPVEFADLRRGDMVAVTHDSAEATAPSPTAIAATRPVDRRKWALLIAQQKHDDTTIAELLHAVADAQLLRDAFNKRFRVPADQTVLMSDESFIRLEQGIPAFLKRLPADSQLAVYFVGQSFTDDEQNTYLAPRDFALSRMATSGLRLKWLIEQVEACPAHEKLLLFDTGYAVTKTTTAGQPPAAELMVKLSSGPMPLLLKSTTTIVGSRQGQASKAMPDKPHGRFGWFLADGYAGRADKNRDNRLEITELYEFVDGAMAAVSTGPSAQTPQLFLPNNAPPPRLTDDAKKSIRNLLASAARSKVDPAEVATQFSDSAEQAGPQPEPKLAYGLVMYKLRKLDDAVKSLEEVKLAHPQVLLSHQLAVWIHFSKRSYKSGLAGMSQMVAQIKPPKNDKESYSEASLRAFEWLGRMREFAMTVAAAGEDALVGQQATKLDGAVAQHGGPASQRYEQGRAHVRDTLAEYNRRIDAADSTDQPKLRLDSRLPTSYATFDLEDAVQQVLERLND